MYMTSNVHVLRSTPKVHDNASYWEGNECTLASALPPFLKVFPYLSDRLCRRLKPFVIAGLLEIEVNFSPLVYFHPKIGRRILELSDWKGFHIKLMSAFHTIRRCCFLLLAQYHPTMPKGHLVDYSEV